MDNITQAMIGSDGFKEEVAWCTLHLRKAIMGALGQDAFEVPSDKTSYKAIVGTQSENLSLIPDQSLFLCLSKVFAFSHQSTYHSSTTHSVPTSLLVLAMGKQMEVTAPVWTYVPPSECNSELEPKLMTCISYYCKMAIW